MPRPKPPRTDIQPTPADLSESFRQFAQNQLLTVLTSTRVLRTQLALMDSDGILAQCPEEGRIRIYEELAQCLAYFQPAESPR